MARMYGSTLPVSTVGKVIEAVVTILSVVVWTVAFKGSTKLPG